MRRLLVVVLLAVGLVPVVGGTAWACSCASYGSGSDEEQYRGLARDTAVIYTGLVTREDRPTPPPGTAPQPSDQTRYTVRIDEALKGRVSGDRVVVMHGACGIDLEPGRRALVLEHSGHQRTSLCDGTTQELVDARAAVIREELRRPSLPHTGALPHLALLGGLLLLAPAVARRRRGEPA